MIRLFRLTRSGLNRGGTDLTDTKRSGESRKTSAESRSHSAKGDGLKQDC